MQGWIKYRARLDVALVGLVLGIVHPIFQRAVDAMQIVASSVLRFRSQDLSPQARIFDAERARSPRRCAGDPEYPAMRMIRQSSAWTAAHPRLGHDKIMRSFNNLARVPAKWIRFADKDMRQRKNLQRFPVISDHGVIRYDRKAL
jgi:hypothetical protein